MGVYTRFKREDAGFRSLIELLETTPISKRQKMIEIGSAEDPEYTQEALKYVLTFEDVMNLPDMELAEVTAVANPRFLSLAIYSVEEVIKQRFLKNSKPHIATEIKDLLESTPQPSMQDIGSAQLKIIEITRSLEKKGLVHTKKIPKSNPIKGSERK